MSSNQEINECYVMLQSGLETVRRDHMEMRQRLCDVQLKLDHSQKRVAGLENENAMLSTSNTNLQQRNEHLDSQRSDLLGEIDDLNEQLADTKGEKWALEMQLDKQKKAHEAELECANAAARRAQEENKVLRERLAKEEQAARAPSLEATQKQYRAFLATMQKAATETSKQCEAMDFANRQASKRRNADVNEAINSLNGVKQECRENITEGNADTVPDVSPVPAEFMPDVANAVADLATVSSLAVVPKKGRGRPRKTDAAGPTQKRTQVPKTDAPGPCGPTATKRSIPPKRPRKTTKMAVTAEDVSCSHESCQRPTGEDDPAWVTCSHCHRWYHCICLNETPNHDEWVCGNCP